MNHWGPPDDEVDFPDWMLPDNHPRKQKVARTKSTMTFEEAIAQAMAKPPIQVAVFSPMNAEDRDEYITKYNLERHFDQYE